MRRTPILVLLSCIACSPPEGRDLVVEPGGRVGQLSRAGDREVWTERVDTGPFTRIVAREGGTTRELVRTNGSADRAVLSADGRWVAFVYAPAGIASIGVVPFAGGAPIQLTNVGLERRKHAPGEAPEGFVPVPSDDSLVFAGDRLEWDTPAGRMSAPLPAPSEETR